MKLFPMGGKSPSNTAVGVSVDADGRVMTKKVWQNTAVKVFDAVEIRDTSAITNVSTRLDCKDAAMVSLRFYNSLGVNLTVNLYRDDNTSDTAYLKDITGTAIAFTVGQGNIIVTPDDVPALKYLDHLKLRIQAASAPSSGSLTVWAYKKG